MLFLYRLRLSKAEIVPLDQYPAWRFLGFSIFSIICFGIEDSIKLRAIL
jgi:hypothetical protein